MINIFNIHKKNSETFYNYSTGEKQSLGIQRVWKIIIAFLLSALFFQVKQETFSTVIAIYSILVGFSFSILFFLLSIEFENIKDEKILENKILKKKLNKLLKELFYNVSYFNLLSVLLIFFSLLSFIFLGTSQWFIKIEIFNEFYVQYKVEFEYFTFVVRVLYIFLFYYILINSIYSFLRTTERVTYFFQEKMKLKESIK